MQIILLLILATISYFLLRDSVKDWRQALTKLGKKTAWVVFALVLLYLATTGKLMGALALMGAALAYLLRMAPLMLHLAPTMRKLWETWQGTAAAGGRQESNPGQGSSPAKGPLSNEQAYEILGLKPGATKEEIVAAHRRLMQKNHPDHGGSDFLAAQINLAKKRLLEK